MFLKKIRQNQFLKNKNALDLIPVRLVAYQNVNNEMVQLKVKRFKYPFLGHIFHRSEFFHINLDKTGSEVWQLINGQRSVSSIIENLKPKNAESEYFSEKVVVFITDLYRKDLITFQKLVVENGD